MIVAVLAALAVVQGLALAIVCVVLAWPQADEEPFLDHVGGSGAVQSPDDAVEDYGRTLGFRWPA